MSTVVGLAIFAVLHAGMLLAARNLAVNLTNNSMRGSLDRAEQILQQADTMPVLINTAGTPASGPAAGVSFDSYLGGPYVVSAPPTGLPANTTVLTRDPLHQSLRLSAAAEPGDILRISNTDPALRPRVSATVCESAGWRAASGGLRHAQRRARDARSPRWPRRF